MNKITLNQNQNKKLNNLVIIWKQLNQILKMLILFMMMNSNRNNNKLFKLKI